jgi:hypothetical protein
MPAPLLVSGHRVRWPMAVTLTMSSEASSATTALKPPFSLTHGQPCFVVA